MLINKKLLNSIFGIKNEFSLEDRIFISAILLGAILSFLASVLNLVLGSFFWVTISTVLFTVILSSVYYFARFKKIIKPFVFPLAIISYLAIASIWLFDGGINGPDIMPAFVILIFTLMNVSDRRKIYLLALFIMIFSLAYLIQFYRPELVAVNYSELKRWSDSLISMIYSSVFIYLIIKLLHKQYTMERHRAEESENKYATLIDEMQLGLAVHEIICDENNEPVDYRFLFVNDAYEKLTGLKRENIIGKTVLEIFPNVEEIWIKKYGQVALTGEKITFSNYFQELGKHYEVSAYSPQKMQFAVLVSDISQRIQTEAIIQQQNDELIKLNTDKDLFLSILAHDLKSPFNSILGFLDLLSENIREYDIDKIEMMINTVNDSVQKSFMLLEDLLMWANSQGGNIPYKPQYLNFNKVCSDIIESLTLSANSKNITINHEASSEIKVFADCDMLKTVLRNLVSNALKFTNTGGLIAIRTEQSSLFLTVSISDNGVGINPEMLKKLFDISQTTTTNGTANETGTGLGLLLCKEFVEKHGGKIWIESKVGQGSTFYFTLPGNPESEDKNGI